MESVIKNTCPDMVRARLRERYGEPVRPQRLPPLDELIRTILSQNTSDRNTDTAYRALGGRFKDRREILTVPVQELERIISPAGLGPTKSRRILDILRRIYEDGDAQLLDLCALPRDTALAKLLSLKGVGPKTAACVLLFSCGAEVFPVDTHIYRVAGRLGLLPGGADRVKAHSVLGDLFPPEHYLELHLNIIRLGREICRPKRPMCGQCPLQGLCPSAGARLP